MPIINPPLDLLRAFEACGRLLSFTAAADELGTTQPAVSQQMKRLELELATRLFDRVYRGIELTAQGQLLLEHVQRGLESLDTGVRLVRAQTQSELLQVATDFAFAAYWLMPRLARFHQRHPQVDVSLITSNRSMSEIPADVDVAITFGDGQVKHGESHLLFYEEVFPVCSPGLLAGRPPPTRNNLASLPLLQLRTGPGHRWFDWSGLFQSLGISQPPTFAPLTFDNYTLLIQAAIAGQGVAIGWRHLVDDLLDQGVLCRLMDERVVSSYGYHLILPGRKRRARLVHAFASWLQAELSQGHQSPAAALRK